MIKEILYCETDDLHLKQISNEIPYRAIEDILVEYVGRGAFLPCDYIKEIIKDKKAFIILTNNPVFLCDEVLFRADSCSANPWQFILTIIDNKDLSHRHPSLQEYCKVYRNELYLKYTNRRKKWK